MQPELSTGKRCINGHVIVGVEYADDEISLSVEIFSSVVSNVVIVVVVVVVVVVVLVVAFFLIMFRLNLKKKICFKFLLGGITMLMQTTFCGQLQTFSCGSSF